MTTTKNRNKMLQMGMLGLTLTFILVFVGCDIGHNTINNSTPEPKTVADNPAKGIMSLATAASIFEYKTESGGIKIDKFKSAAALSSYLKTSTPSSSVSSHLNVSRSVGESSGIQTLYICKIGNQNVVAIGSGAFTPTDDSDTDITTIVGPIKLPPTLTAIAADSFAGEFKNIPLLEIPAEVYENLSTEAITGLTQKVQIKQIGAYEFHAKDMYGKFPGTMTIAELHTLLGLQPYSKAKWRGWAVYTDSKLTAEVSESTRIRKDTLLYANAEEVGIVGELTYPGLDTSNWPSYTGVDRDGKETHFFKKSADGKALAYNAFGRGKDDGAGGSISTPDIWLLQAEGAGIFPVGTWIDSQKEKLIFAATTLTIESPYFETATLDYTVFGDTFVCLNRSVIPYVPTPADNAEIAAFNEAAFRASHPWIPASSTIGTPTATITGIRYNIVDNPTMTPFVEDAAVMGTWTAIDVIDIIDWFDPTDTDRESYHWFSELIFAGNGSLSVKYTNFTDSTTAAWTKNLLRIISNGVTAPSYEIRTVSGTQYLFVEIKNGDYSFNGSKPPYLVMEKQP